MRKKSPVFIAVIILAVLGYVTYQHSLRPDGSTVESREAMLRATPKNIVWSIAQEQKFGDYLLSGIYGSNKVGIAVFEPVGDEKYKLAFREWRYAGDIVVSGLIADGEWYDIVWFNGAATSYAEITYSVDGVECEPIIFDTSDMKIICSKAPAKDYSMVVKYYDNDGNVYE